MLGEVAGTAAALAIEADVGAQDISHPALRQRLAAQDSCQLADPILEHLDVLEEEQR